MVNEREMLRDCACFKAKTAARTVTRAYDEMLSPTGLSATQFLVLAAVGIEGAISISALAKTLVVDRSTLTRTLRPLQKDGLVILGEEGWHRSRKLEITKKGRAKVQQGIPLWEKAQAALKKKLGDRGWSAVHQSLEQLMQTG